MHSNGHDIVGCCGLLSCDSSKEESLDRLPGSLDKLFRMSEVTFCFLTICKAELYNYCVFFARK